MLHGDRKRFDRRHEHVGTRRVVSCVILLISSCLCAALSSMVISICFLCSPWSCKSEVIHDLRLGSSLGLAAVHSASRSRCGRWTARFMCRECRRNRVSGKQGCVLSGVHFSVLRIDDNDFHTWSTRYTGNECANNNRNIYHGHHNRPVHFHNY